MQLYAYDPVWFICGFTVVTKMHWQSCAAHYMVHDKDQTNKFRQLHNLEIVSAKCICCEWAHVLIKWLVIVSNVWPPLFFINSSRNVNLLSLQKCIGRGILDWLQYCTISNILICLRAHWCVWWFMWFYVRKYNIAFDPCEVKIFLTLSICWLC